MGEYQAGSYGHYTTSSEKFDKQVSSFIEILMVIERKNKKDKEKICVVSKDLVTHARELLQCVLEQGEV